MADKFEYDVFLSYCVQDKDIALDLAERLKANGLKVWFDKWVVKPSQSLSRAIGRGLDTSRSLLLLMSKHTFESEWVAIERQTVLFRDPSDQARRFIPIRIDDTPVNDQLRQFAFIDWRVGDNAQFKRLLGACQEEDIVDNDAAAIANSEVAPVRHGGGVWAVAATDSGTSVISCGGDATLRFWDRGKNSLKVVGRHDAALNALCILPDGTVAAASDESVRIWNVETNECVAVLARLDRREASVCALCLASDRRHLAWATTAGQVTVFDLNARTIVHTVTVRASGSNLPARMILSPDNRSIITNAFERSLSLWDLSSGERTIEYSSQNAAHPVHGSMAGVTVTSEWTTVVSAVGAALKAWNISTGALLATFEGHTDNVLCVAISPNEDLLVSGGMDERVKLWDSNTGACLATYEGHMDAIYAVAFSPDGKSIISGSADMNVRVWDVPRTLDASSSRRTQRYTNAKVLLVGESGVGKTGLSLRLAHDAFEPTISTDAHWASQMRLPHSHDCQNIDREIWLWDFAGQADYRLIHQLFMDETALAVLVFNPQIEDPFEVLGQWDLDIQRAARRPFRRLLVAGRCDRGRAVASRESIKRFVDEREFDGYLETSALSGEGCQELRDMIVDKIDWNAIPWTASPRIFKLLKDEILKLRDAGIALLRVGELKQRLEMSIVERQQADEGFEPASFTMDELRAVVALLAGPGIVWRLEFGDFVLLQPEVINAYAAAVIRSVRAHEDEIGVIAEKRVLDGDLDFHSMERLAQSDEDVVLRAMQQVLVNRGMCLREETAAGTLLVFPSYFKRERSELDIHPPSLVVYQFRGNVEEIYATLVVQLHYTTIVENRRLWKYAADFTTPAGHRLGFQMNKRGSGAGEITVHVTPETSDDARVTFIRYVHEHLVKKAKEVKRFRRYLCESCGTPVENLEIAMRRLESGKKDIVCVNCEKRVRLWDLVEEQFAADETRSKVRDLELMARAGMDNESRELVLVGHAFSVAGEAGQIFRPTANSDWGIDGEIEFKDYQGNASGKRIYLQLKSGDSHLRHRKTDDSYVFDIANSRWADYWQAHEYPVMLVIRTSDGNIRWMNASAYLKSAKVNGQWPIRQIVFAGQPFTALNLQRMRDELIPPSEVCRA